MDITWARNLYKTTSIYNIPMRVVHYDRVSSDSDEQLNSLGNQNIKNEELIKSNPNWTYAGKYVDEGISGITVNKREDFQRLIEDAKLGRFDFVITKEISRFARNILDSIKYTRELLSYGVCVFFQNDNINTIEEDAEFRLSIMASVAQEESRKLSSRVKYGHSVSMKNGVILGRDIYGFRKKDKKTYEHDEHYKPMIEYIFRKYANRESSTNQLSDEIYEMGYRSYQGGKIGAAVIKHIITNPKYKGYYCGKKVQIVNMFTKQQKFLDEDEWILYKDFEHIPPIVSEELWDCANEVYKERSNIVKNRNSSFGNMENLFTKKIICADDGCYYWLKSKKSRNRRTQGIDPIWWCSSKKNGAKNCKSIPIHENELIPIVLDIIGNTKFSNEVITKYIELYKIATKSQNFDEEIKRIESEMSRIIKKKDKILDYNLDGIISDQEYATRNNDFNEQLEAKKQALDKLKTKSENSDIEKVIFQIQNTFSEMKNISRNELNHNMIDKLFDKIIATPVDKYHMNLEFILNDGSSCKSDYKSSSGPDELLHSGYMVNTIFPKRHKYFYRYRNHHESSKYKVSFTYSLSLCI